MPITITTTKDNTKKLRDAVNTLTKLSIYVGIPQTAGNHPDTNITNAALGYIHHFGCPACNIPPRPWLYPAIEASKDMIVDQLRRCGEMALSGNAGGILVQYGRLGLALQVTVQRYLTTGPFVPLKPRTLAARRAKGFAGTRPLVVTGALRNSIKYIVR